MKLGHTAVTLRGSVADMLDIKGRVVHAIRPDATVYEAVAAMDAKRVGALVVMDGDALVGIVSERDYTRKVILLGRASRDTRVDEIMTPRVITVTPATTLSECLGIVGNDGIRHLPVVEGARVVGVLSVGDLVRAVLAQQADRIESLASFIASDYPR